VHYKRAGLEILGPGKGYILKQVEIEDATFRFLAWLVRQDVTLPAVMVHYLKWNRYSEEEIKQHFLALHMACIEAKKELKNE